MIFVWYNDDIPRKRETLVKNEVIVRMSKTLISGFDEVMDSYPASMVLYSVAGGTVARAADPAGISSFNAGI